MNTDKLPKWARDHIETLTRERDGAVRELARFLDDRSPSPFRTHSYHGTEPAIHYIQADRLHCHAAGLEVTITPEVDRIRVQFDHEQWVVGHAYIQPGASNVIYLVAKGHLCSSRGPATGRRNWGSPTRSTTGGS